jgi:hypothetical protein
MVLSYKESIAVSDGHLNHTFKHFIYICTNPR